MISVERSPLVRVSDQLTVVFDLQLPQPEGNTSGDLSRRAILDLQGLPFVYCFLSSYFLSSLRFTVCLSQKHGFPLKAGGSPGILTAKTWKYLLKYGCGVRFAFCCYLLLHRRFAFVLFFRFSLSDHLFAILADPLSASQNKESLNE